MFRFLILAVVLAPLACSSAEESSSDGTAGEPAAVAGEMLGPVAGAAPVAEADDGEVVAKQDAEAVAAAKEDAPASQDDASTIE